MKQLTETKKNQSRRRLMKAGVAVSLSGFALAVRPTSAQELVVTDNEGLVEGAIVVGADKISGYRAYPKGVKDAPVIVVVQEIFGVHEYIRDICRRFAKLGYYTIAVDYYMRVGDPKAADSISDIIQKIVTKVPDAGVMTDTDAAFEYAAKDGASNTRRAITGFCWGGRIVWLYAAYSKSLTAGVAWYGRLVDKNTTVNPIQPKYPIDLVEQLKAPVLGLYGGQDSGIPLADVEKMEYALKNVEKDFEIQIYADAHHGFFADYRGSYDFEAAEDGWNRALAWFKKHGV